VDYFQISKHRGDKIAVAVLIDQSGSMDGLVEEKGGSFREAPNPTIEGSLDHDSDPDDARIEAARMLVDNLLETSDKVIVYAFGEPESGFEAVKVACDPCVGITDEELLKECQSEWASKPLEEWEENCFGVKRSWYTDLDAGLDDLKGRSRGRSPLWAAVKRAWVFLDENGGSLPKHIVVINDGPDTCVPGTEDYYGCEDATCSDVSYEQVKELWQNSYSKPYVHFLQFQAPGYKRHDPRQQELACLTGGQYVFINSESFVKECGTLEGCCSLADALQDTVMPALRSTFGGYWTMAVRVLSAENQIAGKEYGLQGFVTLKEGTLGAPPKEESVCPQGKDSSGKPIPSAGCAYFNFTNKEAESCDGVWDRRLPFRLTCADDGSCSGNKNDPCNLYCSPEASVCTAGNLTGVQCVDAASQAGMCCAGACTAGVEHGSDCTACGAE
jgi:hypothetical protein